MVDTVRSLSALETLFADNTAGDIGAQDLRDFLVTARAWAYGYEAGAEDIEWDAAADEVSNGTQLAISGSETIVERFDALDVQFSGQSANDLGGLLYAKSFSTGDTWAVPVQILATNGDYTWAGVMFTDGTDATSNVVVGTIYYAGSGAMWFGCWSGTLTNMATLKGEVSSPSQFSYHSPLSVSLEYSAANTFQVRFGAGYGTGTTFGIAASSVTMTPTHVGVFWSKDGTANAAQAHFGSLRKIA